MNLKLVFRIYGVITLINAAGIISVSYTHLRAHET